MMIQEDDTMTRCPDCLEGVDDEGFECQTCLGTGRIPEDNIT